MAPTNCSNCMPSYKITGHLTVNSFLVVVHVIPNNKTKHDWAVFINFFLHLIDLSMDFEASTLAIVLNVMLFIFFLDNSLVFALKSAIFLSFNVRYTCLSSDSFSHQKVNGRNQVATSASVIVNITINHILRRQSHVNLSLSLLAESIAKDSCC